MNDENKKVLTVRTETIGERIRTLREAKGFSQSSLASELGTVQTVLSMWERGAKEVPAVYIEKLAKTFDVSLDYLTNGKKKASSEVKTYFDPSKIKPKEERENKETQKVPPTYDFPKKKILEKETLLREKNVLNDDGTFKGFRGPTPEMPKVEQVGVPITAVVHEADLINTQTDHWAMATREYGKAAEPVQADIPVGQKEDIIVAPVIIHSEKASDWAKWLARDENGELYQYEEKPRKSEESLDWASQGDSRAGFIEDFEDMYKTIKWEDEEPYSLSGNPEEPAAPAGKFITENDFIWPEHHPNCLTDQRAYLKEPEIILTAETVLEQFLPAFGNFVIDHKVASALDCLLQRPHGMRLTDLKMAKDKLQQAIDYLERG